MWNMYLKKIMTGPNLRVDGHDGFGSLLILVVEFEDYVSVIFWSVTMHKNGISRTSNGWTGDAPGRANHRAAQVGDGAAAETQNRHVDK